MKFYPNEIFILESILLIIYHTSLHCKYINLNLILKFCDSHKSVLKCKISKYKIILNRKP